MKLIFAVVYLIFSFFLNRDVNCLSKLEQKQGKLVVKSPINLHLLNQLDQNFVTDIKVGEKQNFKVAVDSTFQTYDFDNNYQTDNSELHQNIDSLTWLPSSKCHNCSKYGYNKLYNCELSTSCLKLSQDYEYINNFKLRMKGKRYKEIVTLYTNPDVAQDLKIIELNMTIFLVEQIEILNSGNSNNISSELDKQSKNQAYSDTGKAVNIQGVINIQQIQNQLIQYEHINSNTVSLFLSTKSCQNGFITLGGYDNNYIKDKITFFDVSHKTHVFDEEKKDKLDNQENIDDENNQNDNKNIQTNEINSQWSLGIKQIKLNNIPIHTYSYNNLSPNRDTDNSTITQGGDFINEPVLYKGIIESKVKVLYLNKDSINKMIRIFRDNFDILCSLKTVQIYEQKLVCNSSEIEQYPNIIFQVQESEFIVNPEEFVGDCEKAVFQNECQLNIALNNVDNSIILGQTFLKKYYTVFDYKEKKIGIAAINDKKKQEQQEQDIYIKILQFQLKSNELLVFYIVAFITFFAAAFVLACHFKIKFQQDGDDILNNDGLGKYGIEKNETFNSEESERRDKRVLNFLKGQNSDRNNNDQIIEMNYNNSSNNNTTDNEYSNNTYNIKSQSSSKKFIQSQRIGSSNNHVQFEEEDISCSSSRNHTQQQEEDDEDDDEEEKYDQSQPNDTQQTQEENLTTEGGGTTNFVEGFNSDFNGRIRTDITITEEDDPNQLPIRLDTDPNKNEQDFKIQ